MITAIAAVSAGLGAAVVWLWRLAREAAMAEKLRLRDEQIQKCEADLAALRAVHAQVSTLNAQLSTQLAAEHAAHDRLTNEFKALSADALRANRTDFLEQAKQAFAHLQQQSAGDLDQRKQAVEAL